MVGKARRIGSRDFWSHQIEISRTVTSDSAKILSTEHRLGNLGAQNAEIPSGCQLDEAHVLQRHGNHHPTSEIADRVNDALMGAFLYKPQLLILPIRAIPSGSWTTPRTHTSTRFRKASWAAEERPQTSNLGVSF